MNELVDRELTASMRPPHKAGDNRVVNTSACFCFLCFNEAPAQGGG